jgi:hypothetical protein
MDNKKKTPIPNQYDKADSYQREAVPRQQSSNKHRYKNNNESKNSKADDRPFVRRQF